MSTLSVAPRATALFDAEPWRLIYRSVGRLAGADAASRAEEVAAIVALSERNNRRCGLTGALVYENGAFLQVLEGGMAALEATFERIASDLRHGRIQVVEFGRTTQRLFPEWGMALAADQDELRGRLEAAAVATPELVPDAAELVARLRDLLGARAG